LQAPNVQFVIPVYQRNYDWTNAECRELLNDIISVETEKRGTHFIGSIVFVHEGTYSTSEVKELVIIDGQQRLTTLFLLHWYIAKMESIDVAEYKFLNYFSYATRFSSRDFCQELVNYLPDFNDQELSVTIKDQSWYPYEWKNDSTIQSMLVMIDAIHQKFNSQQGLWESLITNKAISFYFLPLSEMGLTDDLYIKMNSRGKPLTPFEHFKAEFEEIVKPISENISKEINRKFDIDWTDMLFPFRGENNIIDDEFMRYFHFISDIITYKSGSELERDEFKVAQLLYSIENEISLENMIQEISVLESQATESEHYEMSEIFKLSVQGLKELQNEIENGTNNLHDEGW
jgi:uncharacterized protein with ParB-like and HNH nuclease domain